MPSNTALLLTLVAVGVQFAQAQYESLLATGKTMSLEELKMAGLQGMAMMIGAAIAHKMLGEGMQEMKALGMRGGAYLKRRARMKQLADAVMTSGSPSTAMELLHETREALDAKGEVIEALGEMPDKELEANGLSRATVKAMAHDHKANVAALDHLETGTMSAQLGLDTVVPGQVYAGEPAAIAPVLDSYRARPGYRIEREGTGYHVVGRDGTAFHILERAPTNDGSANSAASERSGGSQTPAAKTEPSSKAKGGAGAGGTTAGGTTAGGTTAARSSSGDLDAVVSSPPVLDQVELATGVEKGPAYEHDMAELRQFYAEQEAEAQHGVTHSGQTREGKYAWNHGHKAFTFSHGVVSFEVRVYLDVSRVTPAEVQKLKTQVHAGVDQHYNTKNLKVRGPDGVESRLHVEVVFVDAPAGSDIQVRVFPGDGYANLHEWYVDGNPTTHAHEVTHGAFGIKDEYHDRSGNAPDRVTRTSPGVYDDQSIMGDYWVGAPLHGVADPRTEVKQRHLDEISRTVPAVPAKKPAAPETKPPETKPAEVAPAATKGAGSKAAESSSEPTKPNAATSEAKSDRTPPRAPEQSPGAVQSRTEFAAERTERTKALESKLAPETAAVVRDVEGFALEGEWQFEAGLRVGDPLFGEPSSHAMKRAAATHAKDPEASAGVKQLSQHSRRLQSQILDVLRDPGLGTSARKAKLLELVGEFERAVSAGASLFPADIDLGSAFRFAEARSAVEASVDQNFDKKLVMNEKGEVYQGRTRMGSFRDLVDKVISTNRALVQAGDPREMVIVDSKTPNGSHELLVLSRERLEPAEERGGTPLPVQNHMDPNAVTIDVGSGSSSFALDLLQPQDRQGGPVVQTEHGPSLVDGARMRRDLSWKKSVPRTDADSATVFGDPMANLDVLFGPSNVKRVFINNVNAHYSDAQYVALARILLRSMAPEGRVEVQWTNSPEYAGDKEGSRGHIDGDRLAAAVLGESAKVGRATSVSKDPVDKTPDQSYKYSVRPSTRATGVEPGRAVPTDPIPDQKTVIVFGKPAKNGSE